MTWRTQSEALEIVRRQCQADIDPALSDEDINAILVQTARAQVWAPNTTYAYGTLVVPTTRTGLVFAPVQAGTSGATEPNWPSDDRAIGPYDPRWHRQYTDAWGSWDNWANYQGTLKDGTVLWTTASPDFSDIWDIQRATYECWLLKAAQVDVMNGGDVSSAQVGDVKETYGSAGSGGIKAHCLQMADRYRPLQVA